MDKPTFHQHLQTATRMVLDFTRQHCFNDFSDEYLYIITPNARSVEPGDEHLTAKEREMLHLWNQYEEAPMPAAAIVELLHHDGRVPVWIDISVTSSTPEYTIFQLFCSRRLRADKDLMHGPVAAPFHIQLALPPDYQKGVLFDVNWEKSWFAKTH